MSVPPRVAIVTGAASGIGKHWAGVLAARGDEYRLALADVNAAGLCVAFAPSDRVRLHELDVRSVEQWQRVVDDTLRRFGRIDYLFNIAGGGRPGFLLDVPMQLVDTTIDVNLKGQIYGMKIVGPIMVRQGAGHIVNVASLAGVSPTPGNELYSAAKFGLRAVSLATAIRLRPKGVFVTVVCPDLVDTPALTRHLELNPEDVALIHSGPGALSTVDVERAFFRAMRERPLEVLLPRWRGWLAKINNLCPPLMLHLYGPLMRRGLRRLEERKREPRDLALTTGDAVAAAPDGHRSSRKAGILWALGAVPLLAAPGVAAAGTAEGAGAVRELRETLGASINLPGLQNTLDLSWRWRLGTSDSPLRSDAHFTLGATHVLSPSHTRLGLWVELAPLSVLVVRAGIEPAYYFGRSGSLLDFDSYTDDFSKGARDARKTEAAAALGGRAYVAPGVRLRAGPLLVATTAEFEWWRADSPGTLFYEPSRDTLLKARGDRLVTLSSAILIERGLARGAKIAVGATHRLSHVPRAPENDSQRLGIATSWTLGDRRFRVRQPTVLAAVAYYLDDRYKEGGVTATLGLRFTAGGR